MPTLQFAALSAWVPSRMEWDGMAVSRAGIKLEGSLLLVFSGKGGWELKDRPLSSCVLLPKIGDFGNPTSSPEDEICFQTQSGILPPWLCK